MANDFIFRVRDTLMEAGFPIVRLRPLASREEGLYVERQPSTVLATYMDGTQDVSFVVAVYARFHDEGAAIDAAEAAGRILRHADLTSENGSYELTSVSDYAGVAPATTTAAKTLENDLYTYMSAISASITTL